MPLAIDIAFRSLPHSARVEAFVRQEVTALVRHHAALDKCRVSFEAPHQTLVRLGVPGFAISVSRSYGANEAQLEAAIRSAFIEAAQRLDDWYLSKRVQHAQGAPVAKAA